MKRYFVFLKDDLKNQKKILRVTERLKIDNFISISNSDKIYFPEKLRKKIRFIKNLNIPIKKLGVSQKNIVNSLNMNLIYVNGGMHSTDDQKIYRINKFWISDFPTINQHWELFIKETRYKGEKDCPGIDIYRKFYNGSYRKVFKDKRKGFYEDNKPVTCISWKNAVKFTKWLTRREVSAGMMNKSYEYRLPTEIEWEFACVGAVPRNANFNYKIGCPNKRQEFPPNSIGLYDMLGNVFEWCANLANAKNFHAIDLKKSGYRANRGGSWASLKESCLPSYRHWNAPDSCHDRLGFRVILAKQIKK